MYSPSNLASPRLLGRALLLSPPLASLSPPALSGVRPTPSEAMYSISSASSSNFFHFALPMSLVLFLTRKSSKSTRYLTPFSSLYSAKPLYMLSSFLFPISLGGSLVSCALFSPPLPPCLSAGAAGVAGVAGALIKAPVLSATPALISS